MRANNKLDPHVTPGSGMQPSWATVMGGECSHHCSIFASLFMYGVILLFFFLQGNMIMHEIKEVKYCS